MKNKKLILFITGLLCLSSVSAQYSQRASVFSGGGDKASAGAYVNYSCFGQYCASTATNSYTNREGFMNSQMKTPKLQASAIRFSNISRTGMTVKWTRGNCQGSVLLGRESYKIPAAPLTDNVSYKTSANVNYSAAPTAQSAKVLYSGTDANPSVNVTNLTKYKLMYFKVCEFDNEDSPVYLQTENASNPASRWTLRRDGLAEEDLTIDVEYAYPNPATSSISTTLDMFEAGNVVVKLFDETGKESSILYDQSLAFGTHELKFDISSIPSGVYQLVISKGSESIVYPVSIIR
jgi:hypothetical protein